MALKFILNNAYSLCAVCRTDKKLPSTKQKRAAQNIVGSGYTWQETSPDAWCEGSWAAALAVCFEA